MFLRTPVYVNICEGAIMFFRKSMFIFFTNVESVKNKCFCGHKPIYVNICEGVTMFFRKCDVYIFLQMWKMYAKLYGLFT